MTRGHIRLAVALAALAVPALLAVPARAQGVPEFDAPVVDAAGVVPDAVEQRVNAALVDYERRSGRQLAVAVVRTTGDRSLEDYSIDLARDWGVGTEGDDDGVLLLLVIEDRRLRIEVGRGLEGELTDLQSGRIIRERLVPLLRAGRYGEAVQQGADAIRTELGDDQVGALPPAIGAEPAAEEGRRPGVGAILPLLIGGMFLLSRFGRRRRGFGRRGGGWAFPIFLGGGFGGGGRGGFGGGGFGGGGGGGFGGGGASGDW